MEQLQHFCHQHPLIICDELHSRDGMVCHACDKPIMCISTSFYRCAENLCYTFLHKTCAEAPMMIEHPMHSMHHYHLRLKSIPSPSEDRNCNVCDLDLGTSYRYVCPDELCPFQICLNCCFRQERNIKHPGHNYEDHALTLVRRPALFRCDACGQEHEDSSYTCNACAFWMHQKCAFVPTSIECKFHDDHPLALAYILPERYRQFKQMCSICDKEVERIYWFYYCVKCRFFAHIQCATSTKKKPLSNSERDEESRVQSIFLNLPGSNDTIDLMIKEFVDSHNKDEIADYINHWAHKDHPLVRSDQLQRNSNINTTEIQMLCDGCVRPISMDDPFYGCGRCKFFLHTYCAKLPLAIVSSFHQEHYIYLYNHVKPNIYVKCDFCDNICNGMFFYCKKCNFYIDIKCASLPGVIKYVAHRHPLSLDLCNLPAILQEIDVFSLPPAICKECGELISDDTCFFCRDCKFFLHKSFLMLPGTINHRWDPHPIPLVHPPIKDHPEEFYCEICEEEIDGTSYSFYFCRACDQSFHVRCLRPYYAYSNIKFGATNITLDKHPHSLTLAAMQQHKLPHSKCGNCGDRIPDGSPMLECQPCHFRLCTKCDSTSEASLLEYFEYDSTSHQASPVEYFEYDSNSDHASMVEYESGYNSTISD